MAAQLTATNGSGFRVLSSCRVRATTSLPVPLSPVMRTDTLLGATRSMRAKMSCIFLEEPTSDPSHASFAQPAASEVELQLGLTLTRSVGEDHLQSGGVYRFLDEVIGAEFHGLNGAIDGALRGKQDDALLVREFAESIQQFDAIHAWHLHIGNNDARLPGHHLVQGFRAIAGGFCAISPSGNKFCQPHECMKLVFYDQYLFTCHCLTALFS